MVGREHDPALAQTRQARHDLRRHVVGPQPIDNDDQESPGRSGLAAKQYSRGREH
jgi:hypothetical protein